MEPLKLRKICLIHASLSAPTRYRVWHQVEQMRQLGLEVTTCSDREAWPAKLLTGCDLLYIYRLPWSRAMKKIVSLARQHGLPIVFDIDDYMWDPHLRENCAFDRYYSARQIADHLEQRDQLQLMMSQVDALVLSTPFLAQLAQAGFAKPVFVNPNAVSTELIDLSAAASARQSTHPDQLILGYSSGHANVHEADFELIRSPLTAILKAYPQVHLKIIGLLKLDQGWPDEELKSRLHFCPPVDWQKLPAEIAGIDLNLAPLAPNPFTRGKSAVKFLEAALLGVPTVASNLEPYQDIQHNVTGLLAATADEWFNSLAALIESPALRAGIGQAARNYVLTHHTTTVRAANLERILASVVPLNHSTAAQPELPLNSAGKTRYYAYSDLAFRIPRLLYRTLIPVKIRLLLHNIRVKRIQQQ